MGICRTWEGHAGSHSERAGWCLSGLMPQHSHPTPFLPRLPPDLHCTRPCPACHCHVQVLQRYAGTVVATLAGHAHMDGMATDQAGIRHRVCKAVLETPPGRCAGCKWVAAAWAWQSGMVPRHAMATHAAMPCPFPCHALPMP